MAMAIAGLVTLMGGGGVAASYAKPGEDHAAVGEEGSVEQRHVGGISEDAAVDLGIVGEGAGGASARATPPA